MSESARQLTHVSETRVARKPSRPKQLSETAAIISVIERAAMNPDVDVEKMERLYEMASKARARQAEEGYDDAMNAAQEEMRPIAADAANPSTKSRYASYAALDNAIRPIYTKHGFSLSFYTAEGAPAEHVRIACRVARSGHKELPHIDMPNDGKGAKGGDVMTKTHATGSAITYGKRYLLGMIFNIAVGNDDDGNAAGRKSANEWIFPAQVAELSKLIDDVGADRQRFLNFLRIETLAHLPASRFEAAKQALNAKRQGGAKQRGA